MRLSTPARIACALMGAVEPGLAAAEESVSTGRQALEEAWWTGPILAAGANTLPSGHFLVEPYVFDSIRQARYDNDGRRHHLSRTDSYGSLTYVLYGLVDDVTIGIIPRFGYNSVGEGPNSSHVGLSDFMIQGQYRFARFREGSWAPTLSLVLAETLPTGKYDRLGAHPSDGLGSGAYTTTLSIYSQYFLWMPNGRIVRTRLNLSYSVSDTLSVEGVSVYGTDDGFRGHARPGATFLLDSAWEYSVTQQWVLALDVTYQHNASTRLAGLDSVPGGALPPTPVQADSGSSELVNLAPAVEYNWSSRMGVIAGAICTPAGRNASANVTPVIAVNMVF